jgi:hypothetical protein
VSDALLPQLSVDHAVIVVRDLTSAIEDFTYLGFSVTPGGRHEGGLTHNALIVLENGSYLELFAPIRPWIMTLLAALKRLGLLNRFTSTRSSIVRRFLEHVASGEGLADIALLTNHLDRQLAAAREQGLRVDEPLTGGRTRPDGQQLKWRFGVPLSTCLPFLIEDLTPRSLRVPESGTQHVNGVCGIAAIAVDVLDLPQAAAHYQALLGLTRDTCARVVTSPQRALDFRVGAAVLTLVERAEGDPAAVGASVRMDPRRFSIKLRTANKAAAGVLDAQRTHNAMIELISS